ncbi:MAG TPA: cation diffusion facilitator family transporter [Nitrospira sp.]|nr:cation diffusion facilitator family transporter [Nitrospira sp.]
MNTTSSKRVVYAAFIGNFLVAATKFVAASWTGSSAMFSEGIHSLVDTGNQILLLYGLRRASAQPDREHPLGHGRELYFWSFIVALLVFALGAGGTLYEGITHIRHPEPIRDPIVNYVVLALAFVFEGGSWLISFRQFRLVKSDLGFYQAFRRSKDPPSFMILFEDSAALLGIVIAAAATFGAAQFNAPILDGIASVLISLVLATTALLLASESKSLLIGEQADESLSQALVRIAEQEPTIATVNGVLTVQLSPDQVVAALSLEFRDDVCVPEVEEKVLTIERRIKQSHPQVVMLFVKPQSQLTYRERLKQRVAS